MLDEIVEAFFVGAGRAFGYILVEILFEFVFYYIGYPIIKLTTFGKYPKHNNSKLLNDENHQNRYVSVVGLLVTIAVIAIYINYKNQ